MPQIEVLQNEVIRVRTPDGTLFAIVVENDDGSINSFQFTVGKSGTAVTAWANALASIMTLAIKKGATLEELMSELSGITSDRSARTVESTCRSGPEGVWMALVRYKRSKFSKIAEMLGTDDRNYNGPSVAPWAKQRDR